MTRDKAIEKVCNLLNLAANTNHPAEASTARKMAERIMSQHGLRESDVVHPAKQPVYVVDINSVLVREAIDSFMVVIDNLAREIDPDFRAIMEAIHGHSSTKKQKE